MDTCHRSSQLFSSLFLFIAPACTPFIAFSISDSLLSHSAYHHYPIKNLTAPASTSSSTPFIRVCCYCSCSRTFRPPLFLLVLFPNSTFSSSLLSLLFIVVLFSSHSHSCLFLVSQFALSLFTFIDYQFSTGPSSCTSDKRTQKTLSQVSPLPLF